MGEGPRVRGQRSVEQVVTHDDLLAAGADADAGDAAADELLEAPDVGLACRGQLVEGAAAGDVLGPAVQVLVDRLGAWRGRSESPGSRSKRTPSTSYATQTGIFSQPVRMSSLVRKTSVTPL